jgi:hypothetical protein
MAYDIAAWSEFGVAVVSGAAALTGLLFVGRALLALGGGRLTGDPEWLVLIDRFSPRLITTAALIVGGVSLIARRLAACIGSQDWTSAPCSPVS